ncbi:dynein regulatory complex subunit 5 [Poeciliopsis prolifica]|uniref:dynein regulatory complex subunit 5 n=1 Tax=Poeciliopsis prolifica TaxID=188132 RepID=UPI0024138629|nr:dynein regulatory complex subunit 5 [Poeciliopsis prolifica]XP_054910323.1 dynein regulatory complex subunit 5 [Poeciliopsis prolifica]
MRIIIAEDPNWSLDLVPSLSSLCQRCIADKIEDHKYLFEKLTPELKDAIQPKLSLSLPLHVTADLVPDGVFWKRCCQQRWNICDISLYGFSWKRMFFERHLENLIELFVPEETDFKVILDVLPLCKNYVKRLHITQLLLPSRKFVKGRDDDQNEVATLANEEEDDTTTGHFDFGTVLAELTELEELYLVYRIKQCGMNFEWAMFQITDRDCRALTIAFKGCKTLKVLRIRQSQIDDKKCRPLLRCLMEHPSLIELDLSHNIIRDGGARSVAELLSKGQLKKLNICNNEIEVQGAQALAEVLSNNSSLLYLNLRLNQVRDEGGQAIAEALQKNTTLTYLNLAGNDLTFITAIVLSKVLLKNRRLRTLDLSCNLLGDVGGKALAEAMAHNSTLTDCDIRETDMDETNATSINKAIWTNQCADRYRGPLHRRRSTICI